MRLIALLVCSCIVFAQSPGKPGVTDPIKDPRQIPGHANPGPIPRSTPQAGAGADEDGRSRKKVRKPKKSRSKPAQTPHSK